MVAMGEPDPGDEPHPREWRYRLTLVFAQWIEPKKKHIYKRNKLVQINKTLSHLRKKYHNDSGSNFPVTNDRKPEGKVTVEWEGWVNEGKEQ